MNPVLQTFVSQYANSPRMLALINDWNADIDPSVDLDNFFNAEWNVSTASGWGLDVWGRIVGVNRNVRLPAGGPWFGFLGQTEAQPFGQGVFYGPHSSPYTIYPLDDDSFRLLIMTKALANISSCSAQSLNALLTKLFSVSNPGSYCYVVDNLDMTITVTFNFILSTLQLAILTQTGVMAFPSGVSVSITHL
jgi:Protein of unknown function (DUF2612)